jgi:TetR/AcrR family tetracycline transcriptional repressor
MAISREEIVTAALRLLDEQGLDKLSLRRLAGELGISAPTLYWHIRDKRELLDLVVERIVTEHQARQPAIADLADPWERLAESFRRQYHAIIAHHDAARVFAGNRPTEAMLPIIEQWLGLWVKSGFPPGEALTSVISAGSYVIGAALEYQAEAERAEAQRLDPEARRALVAPYANLRTAIEARSRRQPPNRHADFEYGLALLMAGLKARHAELTANSETKEAAAVKD